MLDALESTRTEVSAWFFQDYLPRWVAAGSKTSGEGPEFILQYWDTPMHVTGLDQAFWCLDEATVLGFLDFNYAPLRQAGYSHTAVPDRRVFVYNSVGAAIEVIWSRRRADDSEIQRFATHFEVAKSDKGWRVVGVQAAATTEDSLEAVWPRHATAAGVGHG